MNQIFSTPVATVLGGRIEVADDDWENVEAVIRLDGRFGADALMGLEEFSHLEVLWFFDRATSETTGARHPRGNPDWPLVGIFGQRGKDRPNRLAISRCEILEVRGVETRIRGLDAIDGTPVLDLKPWLEEFGPRGTTFQPAWATELMRHYWVT